MHKLPRRQAMLLFQPTARIQRQPWKSHRMKLVIKAALGSKVLAMDDGLAESE